MKRNPVAGRLIQPWWLDRNHTLFLGPLPLADHELHKAVLDFCEQGGWYHIKNLRERLSDNDEFVRAVTTHLSRKFGTRYPRIDQTYLSLTTWCVREGMPRELLRHLWHERFAYDPNVVGQLLSVAGVSWGARVSDDLPRLWRALPYIFETDRIGDVRQLAALSIPTKSTEYVGMGHTRLLHHWDGTFIIQAVAILNRLSIQHTNELLVAMFGHDFHTPPWGDEIKAIDRDAFDEEKNFVFTAHQAAILDDLGVDPDEVIRIVQGEAGWKSDLLSLVDQIVYTARDVAQVICQSYEHLDVLRSDMFTPSFIVGIDPHVAGIWDAIRVDKEGDRIFFDNDQFGRLMRFLNARMAMFRYIYLNPNTRKAFHIVLSVLARYLYQTKCLLREEIMTHTDTSLLDRMRELIGVAPNDSFFDQEVHMRSFSSVEEALEYQRYLFVSGETFVLTEDVSIPAAKTGFRESKIMRENGEIVSPLQVLPALEEFVFKGAYKDFPFIRVFWIDTSRLPQAFARLWEEIRQFRLQRDAEFVI